MEAKLIRYLREQKLINQEEEKKLIGRIIPTGKIVIETHRQGKITSSDIKRGEFFVVMKYLKEKYEKNNEVSSQLVKKIPGMLRIIIDDDRNEQMGNPIIEYRRRNGEDGTIVVRRCHKIVWGILNECRK